jgi:hypothetical protein
VFFVVPARIFAEHFGKLSSQPTYILPAAIQVIASAIDWRRQVDSALQHRGADQ